MTSANFFSSSLRSQKDLDLSYYFLSCWFLSLFTLKNRRFLFVLYLMHDPCDTEDVHYKSGIYKPNLLFLGRNKTAY